MTNAGKKLEPPLKLDLSFDEALSRFVATKPSEVDESIKRSKTKNRRRMKSRDGQSGTIKH